MYKHVPRALSTTSLPQFKYPLVSSTGGSPPGLCGEKYQYVLAPGHRQGKGSGHRGRGPALLACALPACPACPACRLSGCPAQASAQDRAGEAIICRSIENAGRQGYMDVVGDKACLQGQAGPLLRTSYNIAYGHLVAVREGHRRACEHISRMIPN